MKIVPLLRLVKSNPAPFLLNLLNVGPSDWYLFDHVPRTGGTYFAEVLAQMIGSTTDNFDCGPDYPSTHASDVLELDRYRVVAGHMRLDTVQAFRQLRPRRLISLIRDPASQIESTYTFWRYNVQSDLPHVKLAKDLNFGEFIRVPELRMAIDNPLTRHLFSLWDLEQVEVTETTKAMAIKISDSFDFIAVTERMEDSVKAFRILFDTRSVPPKTQKIDRNASKGAHSMTRDDQDYLKRLNVVDYAVYEHVNARLDSILRH